MFAVQKSMLLVLTPVVDGFKEQLTDFEKTTKERWSDTTKEKVEDLRKWVSDFKKNAPADKRESVVKAWNSVVEARWRHLLRDWLAEQQKFLDDKKSDADRKVRIRSTMTRLLPHVVDDFERNQLDLLQDVVQPFDGEKKKEDSNVQKIVKDYRKRVNNFRPKVALLQERQQALQWLRQAVSTESTWQQWLREVEDPWRKELREQWGMTAPQTQQTQPSQQTQEATPEPKVWRTALDRWVAQLEEQGWLGRQRFLKGLVYDLAKDTNSKGSLPSEETEMKKLKEWTSPLRTELTRLKNARKALEEPAPPGATLV
jgi:hypothetical protein